MGTEVELQAPYHMCGSIVAIVPSQVTPHPLRGHGREGHISLSSEKKSQHHFEMS